MATPVEVPKLGNTVEECLIGKWLKQKGDAVSEGDVIAEIETDKATFEVTAPVSGTLLETYFEEGALVPVFTNLLVIGEPGEDTAGFRPKPSEAAAPAAPANAPAQSAPAVQSAAAAPQNAAAERTLAVAAPVPAPAARAGAWSPRARRFADDHDFHPASVAGSGPSGRVLEEDLRREYYLSPRVSSAAKKQMQSGAEARNSGSGAAGMILTADLGPAPTRISTIRERIARRMRESLASTAQYTLNSSANAGGLLAVRAKVKAAQAKGAPNININDLVTFCAILALREIPDLNAEFIDGKIYKHPQIHIGFACDTPRGLIVPVVRDAQDLAIGELALKMKELAEQAVQGTISADDLSGATFTVSNLGGLGIESFTPLINPPQVAILGVDAIQVKPVRKNGQVEFIDSIGFSLTCDHQVVDGAPGARFLQVLKEKVENVESLCTI
jgi:pyruvate dehydrogenase E2 component (dihydrolipoyllysine-residue acetyltransferase)